MRRPYIRPRTLLILSILSIHVTIPHRLTRRLPALFARVLYSPANFDISEILLRIDIHDNFTRLPEMTVKQHAIKTIQDLPDDVEWEDVKERIEFLSAVEKGLKELNSGQGIPVEEIEREIKAWTLK